jgi:hypothetical protein
LVNTTSTPPYVFTLTNSGLAPLTVYSAPAAGDFAATNTCVSLSPIAVGNGCTISTTFTPTTTGLRNGTVTITDDAPGNPHVITLSGTGIAPTAHLSAASLDFGEQLVETPSEPRTVTVRNYGSAPLHISGVQITGDFGYPAEGDSFRIRQDGCTGAILQPDSEDILSCDITMVFTPTAIGPRTGTLKITDDSGAVAGTVQTVALTGTGIAPAVTLAWVLPATGNFGNQLVGTTSDPQSLTLTNSGTSTLNNISITASGDYGVTPNEDDFRILQTTCGSTLAADSSCTIEVTFTPSARGTRTGVITVTDDAANSPQTVALTGVGIAPVAGLSPPSINFSNVGVGVTSSFSTVTLTNSGDATLHVTAVAVSGDYAIVTGASAGTCPTAGAFTLGVANGDEFRAANGLVGNCTIKVTFTPTVIGTRNGTLTVTDDSLNVTGSVQSVALTGNGRGFAFSIAAGGSSTKTVAAGGTAQYSVLATASGGFAQAVSFTCSVVNYYSSMVCAVDPNSFTFTASATSVTLTVTVTTRARAIGAPLSGPRMPLGGLGMLTGQMFLMFLLMLVALAAGLRQRRAWVLLAAALLFVTMLAACGASQAPPPPGTPAGTYVISVEGRAPDGTVVTTGLTLIVT